MPNEDEPIIRQHLAKFDKLFPALALVLHLVDCAARGVYGPVTKEAALRAAAWCEYLEAHARRCYGLLKDDGLRQSSTAAASLPVDTAIGSPTPARAKTCVTAHCRRAHRHAPSARAAFLKSVHERSISNASMSPPRALHAKHRNAPRSR